MLVLTRRRGDKLYIGDNIVIEILDIIGGTNVRLSVRAPRDIDIFRDELIEATERLAIERRADEVDP